MQYAHSLTREAGAVDPGTEERPASEDRPRAVAPTPGHDGGDLAGTAYWDGARPISTRPGRLRSAFHSWLGRRYDGLLLRLLDGVPQDGALLEIGCAPGWILGRVARLRPDLRLHGVDYSAAGIDDTRRLLDDWSVDAHVEHASVEEYQPVRLFDVVLSAGLLEHYDDPAPIAMQHARLARPGGLVLVTVPDLRTRVTRMPARWLAPADFATHNLALMTPEALAETLTAAGLAGVRSGRAGGPALFVPRRRELTLVKTTYRAFAYAWNPLAVLVPDAISPWHAHVWASGTAH